MATLFRNKGPSGRVSCLCQGPRVDTQAHRYFYPVFSQLPTIFCSGVSWACIRHCVHITGQILWQFICCKTSAYYKRYKSSRTGVTDSNRKKKNLWFGRHIWVLILIWDKSPKNINYLSVRQSLFFAIPMQSAYAMARYSKDRWSTAYFALKTGLRNNDTDSVEGWDLGMRVSFPAGAGTQSQAAGDKEQLKKMQRWEPWKVRRGQAGQGALRGSGEALEELFQELTDIWESL